MLDYLMNNGVAAYFHIIYTCSMNGCKQRNVLCRTAGFSTFPDYLVLHMRKFVMEAGWVPKKLGNTPLFMWTCVLLTKWFLNPLETDFIESFQYSTCSVFTWHFSGCSKWAIHLNLIHNSMQQLVLSLTRINKCCSNLSLRNRCF